eukprot:COSAG01_NODE_1865_length_9036_cov_6.511022_8_plen_249_part_00
MVTLLTTPSRPSPARALAAPLGSAPRSAGRMRDTAKQVALVEEMVEEEAARISASESKLRKLAAGASALASVGAGGGLGLGLGLGGVAEGPSQEQIDYQEVECPAGAAAGDTIEVELPGGGGGGGGGGGLLSVVVPDGVAPGEVFTVSAPALVAEDGGGGGYAGLDDAGTSSHEQSEGVGAAQSFGRLVRQVSRSCACIGSPCLRHCVHGAPITGGRAAEVLLRADGCLHAGAWSREDAGGGGGGGGR